MMRRRQVKPLVLVRIVTILLIAWRIAAIGSVRSSPKVGEASLLEDGATLNPGPDQRDQPTSRALVGDQETAAVGDWPMAGANPQRTSWTPEEIRGRLKPVWFRALEPYISQKIQLVAALDTLFISTSRGLYALSTQDLDSDGVAGEVKWVYPTELPLGHSPTIHNGVAYVGGLDHKIHAIEANPDRATLPLDPGTGIRINDRVLWTFEATAGFQTNPLVIDHSVDPNIPVGEGKLFAGSRDGNLYAIHVEGPDVGRLTWSFPTGGPILYSPAYLDGVIYFASNDAHAYAVNAGNGSRLWSSDKLNGAGFHSWWPVAYTDPQTQREYVIFAGSNNYRSYLEPGPLRSIQNLERADMYIANNIPDGESIAPIDSNGIMTPTLIFEYYEQKPWRRTYFVLDAATGKELMFDYERENHTVGTSYAPITWLHTHGPATRYPPAVGSDGLLYQPINHIYYGPLDIVRGGIVGWRPGSQSVSTIGHINAMDEPIAYSAGGDLVYWVRCCDRAAGAYDITIPPSEPDRRWSYYLYAGELESMIPGYDALYSHPCESAGGCRRYGGVGGSVNGIYGRHGEQSAPIPYGGKLYFLQSNAIVVLGDYSDPPVGLPMVPAVEVSGARAPAIGTEELGQELWEEVEKILLAGHLRPGYLSSGQFDLVTKAEVGDYLLDYWHNTSDTLYTLLLALPHLTEHQRTDVLAYLQGEYTAYPPYLYTHIGWSAGEPREVFELPPEVEADLVNFPPMTASWEYSGWRFPPHTFYALWKYAQVMEGAAADIFENSSSKLQAVPSDDYLMANPHVHNAYIAGYWGYLELEKLAGYPESPSVRSELDRLLALRVTRFSTDSPLTCDENGHELDIARNFMYLVPELGQYLRDHALAAVEEAIDEYEYVAPYWFVTKAEQTYREGVIQHLYDSSALFQAKALILQEPREELLRYLDVPAFERGDLFYIQNLVATIEARPALEKSVTPRIGYMGETISYTLSLFGSGQALMLTDTFPVGVSVPTVYSVEGTNTWPTYNVGERVLTWTETPTAGQVVKISYSVDITTSGPEVLVNTADLLCGEDGRVSTASVMIMANPYQFNLPLILRRR